MNNSTYVVRVNRLVLQCIKGTSTILGLINSFVVVVEVRYVTICFVQYFLNLNAQEITVSKL